MTCEHKRLKTVGHRLFCMDCGAELPIEFLTGKQEKQQPVKRNPKPKKQKEKI